MIDGVINADSIPALERLMKFSGARHRLIAHNIANLDTPHFRPVDVSVEAFQSELGEAIDERRTRHGNGGGAMSEDTGGQVEFKGGQIVLHPKPIGDNLLFHDGNDRDPERIMQSMVENFMTFRAAADLLRSRFDILNTAIRERI